jgi:hypothetical protein
MTKARKQLVDCDHQQVPTVAVTIEQIMASPKFERGVIDARGGKPFAKDYDTWSDANQQWAYERGRQWGRLVPKSVALKRNGIVTTEALKWAVKVFHYIP